MKPMEMDRRTQETLRSIERNESFQSRLNLTPQQLPWEDAYQLVKGPLRRESDKDLLYSIMALVKMEDAESNKFVPLDLDNMIVRAERIFVASLNRLDSQHWKGHNQRRRYRLHLQLARLRLDGEGELWADAQGDDKAWQARLPQKDLAKPPMQDHPRYELYSFNPDGQFASLQDPVLKSPISGKFTLVVNDRHVELVVGDIPVYRLMAEQAATVTTHADDDTLAKDGQHVKRGQALIRLTTRCDYGEIRWERRHDRIPNIDRIGGDVISATREPQLLALGAEMMRRVGAAASEDELVDMVATQALERWAPSHLIEFQANVLETLPMLDDWETTPALRMAIMAGLQPQGDFFVRADVPGPTTFSEMISHDHYVELKFADGHIMVLPKTAKVLEHVQPGSSVESESPIADWTERRFFNDWEDVRSSLPQVAHAAREFLRQHAVRPGTSGFQGEGLLVDQRYLPNTGSVRGKAIAHHVDLRPAAEYLDLDSGTIIGCPLKHEDWTDWYRTANGIGYNCGPSGERFSDNTIVATGSGDNEGRYRRSK